MTLMRKIIRCNGSEQELIGPTSIHDLQILLNATTLDTVNLRDGNHIMLVDDNGHALKKPFNQTATILYRSLCKPGTTHSILGDVAIVPDSDYSNF